MIKTRVENRYGCVFSIRTYKQNNQWLTFICGDAYGFTIDSYTYEEACKTHLTTCLKYRDAP